ncbi:hypothetical protein [Caulobacter sp. NIBR1757]|uniref:hypothetical protein n=1 Tax=Caulobacter sp. NIBR1757 TaxID=3016000 RepID=UPI0022EFE981|nr:hypothetical protein [Caulobacter sp. NIBR1757]WGM38229.1 hypothetical protein AMEJIAPC_01131 [Caulobacter sp. NIBR1757]
MRSALLLAAGLAALTPSVLATPVLAQVNLTQASKGYTYFHKAGADIDGHEAAVKDCIVQASRAAQTDPHSMGSGDILIDVVVTPLLVGGIARGINTNADAANIENCMVVRGWSVVGLDPKEGGAIARLPADQQRAALAPWVGAAQPHGTVLRRFGNDLTRAATKFEGRPGGLDKLSLSISAVDQLPDPGRPRVPRPALYKLVQAGKVSEAVPAAEIANVGPGETVIVFRMTSVGGIEFTGIHLTLGDGTVTEVGSRIAIHQPNSTVWEKKTEELLVFRVPAGRWRMEKLRSALDIQSSLNLCLGAPAFDVAEGEAVFGGSIAIKGDGRFVPLMDIEPARQLLTANPALAQRLKPAAWVNGTTAPCGNDSYQYALEIPGAPTVPAP